MMDWCVNASTGASRHALIGFLALFEWKKKRPASSPLSPALWGPPVDQRAAIDKSGAFPVPGRLSLGFGGLVSSGLLGELGSQLPEVAQKQPPRF